MVCQQQHPMSFVARIWLEPGDEEERVWRGHIQHVQSGREEYFQEPATLASFVEKVSSIPFVSRRELTETDQGMP
jgi:hypothetical protein